MRFETVHGLSLPKIGFGTWPLGDAERANDAVSRAALESAINLGYTLFDTAEAYVGGHTEELLGQAIRASGRPRDSFFVTSKVSPEHLAPDDVLRSCEGSLRRLGMDYLDLYLIHWPKVGMKLPETFTALNQLVRDGRVRWLGVSNFNPRQLGQSVALCETPLLTNQVSYSDSDRTPQKDGVLDACRQHNLLLTAYTPLKHRSIQSSKALEEIARQRGVTRQQVALAWLITQPGVIAIPMSTNPQHQAENLAAGDLTLTVAEMARIG